MDTLIDEVRRRGEEEAAQIMRKAQSEAEEILERHRQEAQAHVEAAKKQRQQSAAVELAEEVSEAKAAASTMVAEAKNRVVEKHLDAVWALVLDMRSTEAYRRLLSEQASQAILEFGPNCRIYCRSEDVGLLPPLKVAGHIDSAGGIIAEDESGRIRLDGRLETLFTESNERLSSMIYAKIFAGDG